MQESENLEKGDDLENDSYFLALRQKNEKLMALVLKYKDAVTHQEYVSVSERENDRQLLNEMYTSLETIREKILDSRCYLELGKLQRQLSSQFLSNDLQQGQRIEMLAFLVRSLRYPIVFTIGRNTLMPSFFSASEQTKKPVEIIESYSEKKLKVREHQFKTCVKILENFEHLREEIRQIMVRYPKQKEWQKKINLTQAQIISQMAAKGEIEITVAGDQDKKITSIVLKQS